MEICLLHSRLLLCGQEGKLECPLLLQDLFFVLWRFAPITLEHRLLSGENLNYPGGDDRA